MEMIEMKKDVLLMTVEAKRFPEGIQEAFDELRKRLPEGDERMPYGISKPERDGSIVYRAAVEAGDAGEAGRRGCGTITLRRGTYASESVSDWQTNITEIGTVFERLLAHPQLDPSTPCIEVYRSRSELLCMVRIVPKQGSTFIMED